MPSKNDTKALIIINYNFNIQINFCNTGWRSHKQKQKNSSPSNEKITDFFSHPLANIHFTHVSPQHKSNGVVIIINSMVYTTPVHINTIHILL